MWLRRSLFFAQFPLAIALPAWVFVTRGILADGVGTQLVAYAFICPIITLALGAIAAVIVARKEVRLERAISWHDAEWQGAIWVLLFAYGFVGWPLFAVLVTLLIIAGFWFEVFELFNETRARMKTALQVGPVRASSRYRGDVVVIEPSDDQR